MVLTAPEVLRLFRRYTHRATHTHAYVYIYNISFNIHILCKSKVLHVTVFIKDDGSAQGIQRATSKEPGFSPTTVQRHKVFVKCTVPCHASPLGSVSFVSLFMDAKIFNYFAVCSLASEVFKDTKLMHQTNAKLTTKQL